MMLCLFSGAGGDSGIPTNIINLANFMHLGEPGMVPVEKVSCQNSATGLLSWSHLSKCEKYQSSYTVQNPTRFCFFISFHLLCQCFLCVLVSIYFSVSFDAGCCFFFFPVLLTIVSAE